MIKQQSILDDAFEVSIPCLRLRQPIGEFFIATIDRKTLCQITYADVRRMSDDRQFEQYLGIQRPLAANRVKEISQYVNTVDACFPTAVILAIEARCVEFDEAKSCLKLTNFLDRENPERNVTFDKIAQVLDGQHRIAGLMEFNGDRFDINVSIFIDMDVESQAYIFSTVNLAQTKVNKSLVYDLFELAKARSPQKTCHQIAVALNSYEKSPFHSRIKRLGTATNGKFSETLTQATFVESLIAYLTPDKVQDRDTYKRGKTPKAPDANLLRKHIFRSMFIQERDMNIADVLSNFFTAVAVRWPAAWSQGGEGSVLNKTNGFRALIRFLKPAYLHLCWEGEIVSVGQFTTLFDKIDLEDNYFTIENFKPGTSGESTLFRELMERSELGSLQAVF